MRKNFLKRYASKAAVITLAGFILSGCAAGLPTENVTPWSGYLHDDARTNVTPDPVTPPLKKAWDKDISAFNFYKGYPKEQLSAPALSGGVLYVGSTNGRFYAIEMANGRVLWRFDADTPIEAPPAVAEDRVCFGSSDGIMRCFDHEGKPLWEFRARSEILSSPVIRDGRVYFSSSDDRVYGLDAATGEKVWSYNRSVFRTVSPRIYASPAYYEGRLYHFFSDGTLVCLSAGDGKELWEKRVVKDFDSSAPTRRTPLVHDGVVYTIDEENSVLALDYATGNTKGVYNIIKANDFVVENGKTLVVAGGGKAVALNMSTGAILWKKDLKRAPFQSIFGAGDLLFVLSNQEIKPLGIDLFSWTNGYIEALKLTDGTPVWEKKLSSSISANGAGGRSVVSLLPNEGDLVLFAAP